MNTIIVDKRTRAAKDQEKYIRLSRSFPTGFIAEIFNFQFRLSIIKEVGGGFLK